MIKFNHKTKDFAMFVRLTKEMYAALTQIANTHKVSKSEVARKLIEKALNGEMNEYTTTNK